MKYSVSLEANHATVDIYGVAIKNGLQRVIFTTESWGILELFGDVHKLPEEMEGTTLDGDILYTIDFVPFEDVIVEIHP